MHKFLRAVGLSDIKKEELEKICKDIEEKPDTIKVAEDSEGNEFAELCHQFGDFFGLTLRGTYRKMTHLRWIITIRIFLAQCYPQENRQKWKNMRKKSPMRGYVMKSE